MQTSPPLDVVVVEGPGQAVAEVPHEGAEAEPEVVPTRHAHFTRRKTQGGPPPDTRIYPRGTRARSTGHGASLVTNVPSHRHALGKISPLPRPTTAEPGTSLQTLTKKFILCCTIQTRKYIQT